MSHGAILIVDDNDITLETCGAVLAQAGYEVSTVSSPLKLTPAIREHRPHLILLDVRMPALSGEKAAQILGQYKFSKDITVLLHSSLEDVELQALVEKTGVAGYIRKPTMGADLIKAVAPWVAEARQGFD